jgi:hypothetical protein
VRRYVDSLHPLLARTEAVTLIVGHELGLRYVATAAAGPASQERPEAGIAYAVPYLFDEPALRRAAVRLDALAPPAAEELRESEAA